MVTCPCALSLAIPTAWTVTIRRLRRLGILLLNPTHLLAFARSNDWFFDKTGTLTEGRFQRLGVKQLGTTDMDQALSILSGLEQGTVHPIAKAFEDIVPTPLQQITHLAGQGVSGVLNGTQYRVRQSTLEEMNPEFEHALQITLETDEGALISVALDDALRPDAKHTIEALQAMNIRLTILSGDREDRVQAIAQSLQIDHALAQCRPEDKLRHLRHISASTVMVGDGLNDSPVLAAANGSITFAQAADLTRLSAGAILLSPELKSVLKLRETAQKTTQVIRQSLFWVLVYNAIAVPFAMSGWVPPWLAAIGMSASSLFVITNALRLNRIS